MEIQSETVMMDQKAAIQILDNNPCNRPLTQAHVNVLAREMKSGDWKLTGQEIQISRDNTLIDGQHRLWAVVESGETVPMRVGRGYAPEIIKVLDTTVKKRSFGEALALDGYKNSNQLASILRVVYKFMPEGIYTSESSTSKPTMQEMYRLLARFPQAAEWAHFVSGNRAGGMLNQSQMGGLGVLFEEAEDGFTAQEFFHSLLQGTDLREGSPILALRNKLIRDQMNPAIKRTRSKQLLWMVTKAWNKWIRCVDVKMIRINSNEEFPAIEGLDVAFDPSWTGEA